MDLAKDTAVTKLRVAPGWYTAQLGNEWDFRTPSGGVLMTVAMRAMQEELGDPELHALSANTHFCSPVPAGPLEIRVEVLRHGQAAAQVRAQLSSTAQPGPGLEVSATFVRHRDGIDVVDATMPDLPQPDAARLILRPPGSVTTWYPPFYNNFETRLALGAAWWERDWEPGPARIARWFRYKVGQTRADGCLDPFALPPVIDTMPQALLQFLGPDHPPFHAPSLDLTVHFLEDTRAQWLLTDVRSRRARAGYATADCEVWDDQGRLIAFATQTMMLRTLPEMKGR